MALPTVCVIGTGSSGIAAAKALHAHPTVSDDVLSRVAHDHPAVDFDDYLFDLRRERRRGRRRAVTTGRGRAAAARGA